MAGQTISITFRFKGNNADIRSLSNDFGSLRDALQRGIAPADRLRTSLINFNQVQEVFTNVANAVRGLSDMVSDLAGAYAVQIQAETQLETVMRQRMDATDSSIQSIKDLCSAQQQLGVIGDEVQLAGVQQLATFLNQKDALAALIPAMNNLAAQQKGLNASQGDMVSIANLMGKAMQGQTSALRRVGITFSEAQEEAVKYGSEQERAAALAEIITANVGNMNAELAKTDAGRAKQVENALGDIKEQLGGIVAAWAPYTSIASQVVMLVTNFSSFVAVIKSGASAVWTFTGRLNVFTTVTSSSTFAVRALSVAVRGLMAATGVGLAIAALTWGLNELLGSADDAASGVDRLKSKLEQNRQEAAEAVGQYQSYIATLRDFKGSKKEEEEMVRKLNDRYGRTMGYFSSVSDWYKTLIANSQAYTQQLYDEAKARAYQDRITELEKQKADIRYDENGNVRRYSTAKNWVATVAYTRNGEAFTTRSKTGASDAEVAQKKFDELSAGQRRIASELARAQTKVRMPVTGSPVDPNAPAASPKTGGGTSHARTGSQTAAPREETLREQLQKKITEELKRANEELTQEEIAASQKRISGWQEEIAEIDAREKAMTRPLTLDSLKAIDEEIAYQNTLLSTAAATEIDGIQKTIEGLQRKREEMTRGAAPLLDEIGTYEQLDKAVAYYTQQMTTASATQRAEIQKTLNLLKGMKDAWDDALNPKKSGVEQQIDSWAEALEDPYRKMTDFCGKSVEEYSGMLDKMRKAASGAFGEISEDYRAKLKAAMEEVGREMVRSLKTPEGISDQWSSFKGMTDQIRTMTTALKEHKDMWTVTTAVVDTALSVWKQIERITKMLENLSAVLKLVKTGTAAASAAEQAATSSSVAGSSAKTTANVAEAASGAMAANSKIPFVGIALGLAAVASIIAVMSSLPKFAKGGIAFGPTLGLFGEYPGASNNPEVVAPLSRLREMLDIDGGGGMPSRIKLVAEGSDLVAVLGRRGRVLSRT